jgi:hypothetical protein
MKVTTRLDTIPDNDSVSELSLFNDNSSDRNLFNLIDEEIYKYYPSDDIDDVYMESKKKVISNEPIILFGNFDPRPFEEHLSQFGLEIQNDQTFIFNKSYVVNKLGREIIPGDILKTVFQNEKYEVFEVQEDSFESYGIYHLTVSAKLLRDTETIRNEVIVNKSQSIGGIV